MNVRGRVRRAVQLLRARAHGHAGALLQRGVQLSGSGSFDFGRRALVREDAHIFVGPGARLTVAPNAVIGIRNRINVATELTIGTGSELSWDVQIMDTDFHEIVYDDGRRSTVSRAIHIGDHVLIGACALILKGVTIGDGAIVAAGSVVTRDVPTRCIVAGNPARVVREGVESWK